MGWLLFISFSNEELPCQLGILRHARDCVFHHMAFNSTLLLFLIQQLDPPQKEQLQAALADMDLQLRKLAYIPWLWQLMEPCDEEVRRTTGVFS